MEFFKNKKIGVKAKALLLQKQLNKISDKDIEDMIIFFQKYLEERKKDREKK